jgi:hypothetical protein
MESLAVPADTSLDAAQVEVEVLRRAGPQARAKMTFSLCRFIRSVAEAGIRTRHPDYSERTVRHALAYLTLGWELFEKVYPGIKVKP